MLVTLLGVNSHNRIEIYIEITNFSCMKSIIVIKYCLFVRRRHVGMADEADSKSVVGNYVWVQVPLPALFQALRDQGFFLYNTKSLCNVSVTQKTFPEDGILTKLL